MAITTQLVGNLGGSKGYYFPSNSVKTYELPKNPNGWSILFVRWSGSSSISYTVTNRITGEVLSDNNVSAHTTSYRSTSGISLSAARDGINLNIRNSTDLRICIASGVGQVPSPITSV